MNACEAPPFMCATPASPTYCCVKWHATSVGLSQLGVNEDKCGLVLHYWKPVMHR